MRTLIALVFVLSSCSIAAATEPYLAVEGGGDPAPAETVAPTTTDGRIPGGWFLYPGAPAGDMCSGLLGHDLPCNQILNVCGDVGRGTVWLTEVFYCTSVSPSWADVCATRPDIEWPYYGLAPERCAALLGG